MTALPVPPHPVLGCLAEMERALDEIAGAQPVYLSTTEKAEALQRLSVLEARVTALRLRVIAAAGDVAQEAATRDVAAWFSHHTMTEPEVARADERLARSLDRDRPHVAAALAAGRCSVAQARVIVRCLDQLPARVGRETLERAEATLVGYAEQFRPGQLRRLGRRVLEVVAPEVAEAEEARRLECEERHAQEVTRLSLRPLGDGTTRITGRVPDAVGSRLRTYLEAFTSPRVAGPSGPSTSDVDRLPLTRRRGEAFCALLENLPTTGLPRHGGTATSVMVMLDLDTLRAEVSGAGVAETSTGDRIPAGHARRLARTLNALCDHYANLSRVP